MLEIIRFIAKVLATPIIIIAFGFLALGGLIFLYPLFKLFDFLTSTDEVTFADMRDDAWEMFTDPLQAVWSRD
jgi:hypothetical protein